jgi:hypothetical protein
VSEEKLKIKVDGVTKEMTPGWTLRQTFAPAFFAKMGQPHIFLFGKELISYNITA